MSPADLAQIDFSKDADRALAALSDDEFEAHFALLVRASRALEARVIAAVNHARHRRIWHNDGLRTTADWVAHKLGTHRSSAAQMVRIGAACERLPALATAVLDGDLGTERAFVMARHATPDSIDEMLDSCDRHDSIGGLVQGVKIIAASDQSRRDDTPNPGEARGTAGDPDRAVLPPPPHHRPSEIRTTEEPDGRIVVIADLTPDDGHLLLTQLHRATEANPTPTGEAAVPWRCRLAASLLHLVCGGTAPPAELVVHLHDLGPGVDPYAETSHGKPLDHHLLERLRCNPVWRPILHGPANTIGIGRAHRDAPAALTAELRARDRHQCRFPGCTSTQWLHNHHLVRWADGGRTDAGNLVTLCSFHHTLAHEGRWRVVGTADALVVERPNGSALTDAPLPPPPRPAPPPSASGPDELKHNLAHQEKQSESDTTPRAAIPPKSKQVRYRRGNPRRRRSRRDEGTGQNTSEGNAMPWHADREHDQ